MSYCRFQNTRPDLLDCVEALEDIGFNLAELSEEEARAADKLIQLCQRVVEQAGDQQ
jgi:hypothetical protein